MQRSVLHQPFVTHWRYKSDVKETRSIIARPRRQPDPWSVLRGSCSQLVRPVERTTFSARFDGM